MIYPVVVAAIVDLDTVVYNYDILQIVIKFQFRITSLEGGKLQPKGFGWDSWGEGAFLLHKHEVGFICLQAAL